MPDFPLGSDVGGTHAIGATYPHPETGIEHIYRGNYKWQIFIAGNSADLTNFYTKSEIDAAQAVQDADIATNTADIATTAATASSALTTAQGAIPTGQKGAANGVASLGSDGKVPNDQLPDAVVTGVPSWGDITDKPTAFTPDSHTHAIGDVTGLQTSLDAKLATASYTASDVKNKLVTVDGSGSGVDADLLDGNHASAFSLAGHDHTGVYAPLTHSHSDYFTTDLNTSPVSTNYAIGTILMGEEPSTGTLLNASLTLYVDDNDDGGPDLNYRRAVTTTATDNQVLSGTWRFRGRSTAGAIYQRVL